MAAGGKNSDPARGSPRRVLVVDREHAICDLVTSVLEDMGYSVSCAVTALEARDLARRDTFHCALIEVILPDATGEGLADDLSALGIPATLMSGHPEGVKRGRSSRYAFLQKPFGVRDLVRTVVDQIVGDASKGG